MRIEDYIQTWPSQDQARGEAIHARVSKHLDAVLLNVYRGMDANLTALPPDVLNRERRKFRAIATGNFTPDYFAEQAVIARNIAQVYTYPQYLLGYAEYAGGLVNGLLKESSWSRAKRDEEVGLLLRSIFNDVTVALFHFFNEMNEKADGERAAFNAAREAEARHDEEIVNEIGKALRALENCRLDYRIDAELPQKAQQMKSNFNEATERLATAMSMIRDLSNTVGHTMEEIASATNSLSQRTEQQAAAVEETSAALAEINQTVRRTAEGAVRAKQVASEARADAARSGEIMSQAESAMAAIAHSSGEINQIVSVIDEIAFQTNLLALNAGVEAARAGEAGKGFAVVASEVRALAQRSSDASKQIRSLIGASAEQVTKGVGLVNSTGEVLKAIVAKVSDIDSLITGISASAGEQSAALGEVTSAVGQMDKVIQQNAAMVEESSAATEGLRDRVRELAQLVDAFDLGAPAVQHRPQQARRRAA
ncbi:methyl-accepting chemotaxis protein [Rhizobium sp. PP-F2F-G36]|nr:methyl-accepting chemotaxis protein [Rhizobium sp. PP-CC-2G-626]TCQ12149.1 methyl-accepting chemotaxis protein [Rhizobium sp. PP-F2F-G36]